jgi:hypothetical protein
MRLIGLAVVIAVSLAGTPLAAEAQQPGKIGCSGFLHPGTPPIRDQ